MIQNLLETATVEKKKTLDLSDAEREFVDSVWRDFADMYAVRREGLEILGGRTLEQFWDQSVYDYAVITGENTDPNDPVIPYASSISRDKANTFIANLASKLYFPSVSAQNSDQEMDKVMTRIGKPLLEWAHSNDGFPDENGHLKMCRYIHQMVVTGTCFVMDNVTKDGLYSQLVPNDELYVPNLWQHSIQRQPMLIRNQMNLTWGEAEAMFGHLDRWGYVDKSDKWMTAYASFPMFKNNFEGIVEENRATILWVWKKATGKQLRDLKKAGKVKSGAKRACFHNLIINDVLMFPEDNLSPYRDGYFPITKMIFEPMAKAEFFYGNSLPSKIREDKSWIDSWKTMLRFLAKQNALRPLQNLGGGDFDDSIYLPGAVTNVDDGIALAKIEGVGEGISQSHVQMLRLAQEEIERGSVSPVSEGQNPEERQSATASSIVESNARKQMSNYEREVVFFCQARSVPLLMRLFQFLPRRDIKRLSIPEQTLFDGSRGNLEIVFKKLPPMTGDERLQKSMDIYLEQETAKREKNPKELVFVDPSYLDELTFYIKADAGSAAVDAEGTMRFRLLQDMQLLLGRPDLFDSKAVARKFLQTFSYDDTLLAKGQENATPVAAPPGSMAQPQLQPQIKQPLGVL